MFKLFGVLTGGLLIIIIGIAWIDVPQAKKVSSQLHDELNQVIDHVAQSSEVNITPSADTENFPKAVQELVDAAKIDSTLKETEIENDEPILAIAEEETNTPWHVFWKPFSSLHSAEGFASRLTQQTGIKVTVVTAEDGQHLVNFSYVDEQDRLRILKLIQQKTGLQVVES